MIEARETSAGSYRIEKREFEQMTRDAAQTPPGLKPAMQIQMGSLYLMVVSENDWLDMYEENVRLRAMVESGKP